MRNISRKDSLARLAEWGRRPRVRGPKFEVFGTSNPELRTLDRAFLASLVLRAPWSVALADVFSILLAEGLSCSLRRG